MAQSRNEMLLETTLAEDDTVMEPNMFPCKRWRPCNLSMKLCFSLMFFFAQMLLRKELRTTHCGASETSRTTRYVVGCVSRLAPPRNRLTYVFVP